MNHKYYRIAGLRIHVESPRPIAQSRFYPAFYAPPGESDLTVTVTEGPLPPPAGRLTARRQDYAFYGEGDALQLFTAYAQPGGPVNYACRTAAGGKILLTVDHPAGLWDSMLFYALNLPELLAQQGAFLCHSSFIIHRGAAVIFTADKGAGKSTQAALWAAERGAQIINGDRSLLRCTDGRLTAWGTPYCGSSAIALNRSAPVKAVILLEKGDCNRLTPCAGMQALLPLLAQLSFENYQNARATDFALAVCRSVPVYALACLPDASAVALLEKTLWPR